MRKILASAICLLATIVSAKTSVAAKTGTFDLITPDLNKGFAQFQYALDFGYGANTGYAVDDEANTVTASATAGLYSQADLVFVSNFQGLFEFNVKIATVPVAFNPVSTSASWTHPIAVSQGEEMTGVISAGYSFTLGDVQVYYYINNLLPKVSILDYLLGDTSSLVPSDVTTATTANSLLGNNPAGYDWAADHTLAWTADPYLNFNLGDWINENTDVSLTTAGDYIEPIDLFAEYNETK